MKTWIKQNKELKNIIRETSEIAGYLWQRGWAERNASNISVNITGLCQLENAQYDSYPYFKLPLSYPKLSDSCFFVTGTGKRMRDLARKPYRNSLLIKLNDTGSGYWIISQNIDGKFFMPTSELPTHLGIHQMISERGSSERVVMHTHAHELVTLTHAKEFCTQDVLNKLLWSMHPETLIFVPKGIGFVPFRLPGSEDIAEETIKSLQNHDVALWEKHGVVAIGTSVADTFDTIDILAKSARIFFLCQSANIVPNSFTDAQLDALRELASKFQV